MESLGQEIGYFQSWIHNLSPWVAIGLAGQALFASRFIVQWWCSEKAKRVVIPPAVWWMSLGGGLIVLSYGIHEKDLVITLGQLPGSLVYARNLWLLRTSRRQEIVSS